MRVMLDHHREVGQESWLVLPKSIASALASLRCGKKVTGKSLRREHAAILGKRKEAQKCRKQQGRGRGNHSLGHRAERLPQVLRVPNAEPFPRESEKPTPER